MFPGSTQKIVATIEARMTSSRLPGKILLPIGGRPALELLIERLKRSRYLDSIVVATTTNSTDDPTAALARRLGVGCFRGSETDVLGRVLGAAQSVRADMIVEITGDCPFVDWRLVDRGITEFFSREVDYASNTITATYPNGFDVQVFPVRILAEVACLTQDPVDRTHVSYYIYQRPERYRLHNWTALPEFYSPDFRVTLDEPSDYQVLQMLYDRLARERPDFSAEDVIQLLKRDPSLMAINAHVRQKEAFEL